MTTAAQSSPSAPGGTGTGRRSARRRLGLAGAAAGLILGGAIGFHAGPAAAAGTADGPTALAVEGPCHRCGDNHNQVLL